MASSSTSYRRRVGIVLSALTLGAGLVLFVNAGTLLIVQKPLADPDAILSLASHEAERLPVAVRLAQAAPASRLLLTVPVVPSYQNCSACGERVGWVVSLGLPRDRVDVLERRAINTYDEALVTREYCLAEGITRLVVVTTPYHTRRTLATFIDVFQDTDIEIGVEPAFTESPTRAGRWWAWNYDREYVAYEWSALVWYALNYGVNPLNTVGASQVAVAPSAR